MHRPTRADRAFRMVRRALLDIRSGRPITPARLARLGRLDPHAAQMTMHYDDLLRTIRQ